MLHRWPPSITNLVSQIGRQILRVTVLYHRKILRRPEIGKEQTMTVRDKQCSRRMITPWRSAAGRCHKENLNGDQFDGGTCSKRLVMPTQKRGTTGTLC